MSRSSTPKDNAVMERFVRTFKEHKINGIKIQDKLDVEMLYDPQFISFRKLVSQYVKSFNQRVNKKTSPDTPERAYMQNKTVKILPTLFFWETSWKPYQPNKKIVVF